jgi:hypothetical protein
MKSDVARRTKLARTDDVTRRGRVITARKLIYEKNYAVNSTAVESLLKEQSLVPTTVRHYLKLLKSILNPYLQLLECVFC